MIETFTIKFYQMKNYLLPILILSIAVKSMAQPSLPENKKQLLSSITRHEKALINISDSIWNYAETAFGEHRSSKILADYAEKNGFVI